MKKPNAKQMSFRLDQDRMKELAALASRQVPPVSVTYLVELAIAEYLAAHGQEHPRQDGPRRSPVPPPEAIAAAPHVEARTPRVLHAKRGKGRQAEVDQHGPALVVGDALASTSVERAAMVGTGAPGGGMAKFNPLGAAEPWTGK